MIYVSKRPDQIPNCYLWYDFSDLSTMISYSVPDASFNNQFLRRYGTDIKDGDQFHSAVDKIRGITISSHSPLSNDMDFINDTELTIARRPIFRKNAINGLSCISFGESGNNSNMTYQDGIFTWPNGFDSYYGVTFSGLNISDRERTIFLVYQCRGVDYSDSNISSSTNNMGTYSNWYNDSTYKSWSRTNVPEGYSGAIMSISTLIDTWYDSANNPTYMQTKPVSYLNLLKYSSSFTNTIYGGNYTVLNYMGHQGYELNLNGYPSLNLDDSNITKYRDNLGQTSLFVFRVNEGDGPGPKNSTKDICNFGNFKTEIKSKNQIGVVSVDEGGIGLYKPIISLGSGSRHSYFTASTSLDDTTWNTLTPGFYGYIGEFIYYDRKLSDAEVKQVELYLKKKWNI